MDFITQEAQTHNFVKNALYATLEPLTENLGLKWPVLDRPFRLVRREVRGIPRYRLEVR